MRLATRIRLAVIGCAGLALAAGAQAQEAVVLVGAGTQSAPYEIADYDDLLAFADIVRGVHETIARNGGAWAVLTADIDASGNWRPIGDGQLDAADAYTGTFDGRGHVIRHLSVDKTDLNSVGLFGTVGTVGVVRNVGLEDGSIKSTPTDSIHSDRIGGVVGLNYGTVENCHNAGSVSGGSYVGGVVGYNEGTVRNCYNAGAVHSYCDEAGGVVGRNYGTVENCHNTGAVIGGTEVDSEESGFFGFGGVVGSNVGGAVRNCYNTGDVTGDSRVGGVVGDNQGTVSNCYNAGDVSGEDEVGGVAGYNSSSGTVSNACYNTAVATSVPSPIGGGTTSGAKVTNVKGLSEEDMQGTNALRNIGLPDDVWVATPGYPLLKGFDVPYLDPVGGTNAVCAVAIPYFGQDTLTSGWYVVSGAVTNGTRIVVSGDVNLLLRNGAELVAQQGINVSVIGNVTNRLAIWAQSTNESTRGSLTATGGKWQAGIGGNDDCGGGTVIVNGGRVTAFGGRYGSGIGGGDNGDGGNVTVNGGRVTAIAESHDVDESGAGIGGGSGGAGGYVTINGGDVTATGYSGAGIGGGFRNYGGMVTIRGGTVTANSSNGGAGIGGGVLGGGGDVVISGGIVTATGSRGGAGIGGGYGGDGGHVTITGGVVTAIAGENAQAIGHGEGEYADGSGDLSFNGMKVFASQDDMDAIPDRPVAENLRKSTCQSEWVALSVCDPHDYDGDSCRWCGAENPLKPIAASATGWTGAYDGQGHGVDVAVTDPSDESPALRFTLDDPSDPDTVWSESAPTFTNVCDETVWVELSAEGYRTATISAAVTIVRAPLAITAKDQTYVYNGRPQGEGDPVYVDPADIAAKVDVAGLAPGDALAGIVLSGHQTDPGVYTNWIAPSDALVTNAMGDATSNYDIGYTNGTLTIEEPPPPTVSNVRARQRWPWNGLVDVDYEVGGYTTGMVARLSFAASDGRSWIASNFLAGAEPSAEPGAHRATWDTAADGATDVVAGSIVATVTLVNLPYVVRYDGNGGAGVSESQKKRWGETFRLNENPFSCEDFLFMAWNTAADGSGVYYTNRQEVADIGPPGGGVTLFACWVGPDYTIQFDANGGVGEMADQTATRGVSTKLNKLAFRRENAYFTGWNTKPDGTGVAIEPSGYVTNPAPYVEGSTLSFTDEVTLYAQWQFVTAWFRVDFEANEGTWMSGYSIMNGDDWQWIHLNTAEKLKPVPYEREGFRFAGWNTKPDGTGVPYEDQEEVYNVSGDYDTPDLFAQWEPVDP